MDDSKRRPKTITDKVRQAWENSMKISVYEETNKMFELYSQSIKEKSLPQYRSAIRRCEEVIGKQILDLTMNDIETYVSSANSDVTRSNQRNYIKGFMRFAIMQDLEKNKTRVSKETFVYLFLDAKFGLSVDDFLEFIK